MTTFTALGDSITLGVGDPVRVPGQRMTWRGWAALLAEGLCDPTLHILATNGALAVNIESEQLPRALELRPELASVVFGVNDTLRSGFDPDRIAAAAMHTVGALRASGAEVLTMRLPDPGRMLGLPGALARPLARRAHQVNAVMDAVAERFGTVHFDAASDPEVFDPEMWAVDRLHPSERGHRLIARRFHEQLAAAGHAVGPAPDAEPSSPPPSRIAELGWMATKGTAWVVRRSTDLVPGLLAMAVREWFGRQADRPWAGQEAIMAPSWNPIGPVAPIAPAGPVPSGASAEAVAEAGLVAQAEAVARDGAAPPAGPAADSGPARDLAHLVSRVEGSDLV
jgi:lysophospholipase L1-like esterase